ncbi:MAG TPA: SDR family oxidoreductase [Phycisphaerales bacterium]|nr:SDR family oxidoreductase [Phycisphaerales bacterium]HRQ75087.1 SDR family oxidoreductase [Phycisphaerales bacterium]
MDQPPAIFVTGATGYIGGRLAPRLLQRGYRVTCFVRNSRKLLARPWAEHRQLSIIEGDASDEALLIDAMRGCEAAYFLVHSMDAAGPHYRTRDLQIARAFGNAAAKACVKRILYLGGLGETGDGLSEHLASRREVEAALKQGGVPVTVLRAAMIIGSGSASFEILRYLVERLPIMVTPRWVRTESQPIAVRDVLHYLIASLETPETAGRTLDIGGPDVWSYARLMREMADAMHLRRRLVIPVPVLTPRLSSLWIHLVTPLHASIARPLAEGLRNRVVCRNDDASALMPHRCLTIREAIDAALTKVDVSDVETVWSDAGVMPGDPTWAGGTEFVDRREVRVHAPPLAAWNAVCSIGGERGYYACDWLWGLRGALDRVFGGPGLRRGRRHPTQLRLGDALDFWRVTAIEPPRSLSLTAEMKLPGVAMLNFDIEPSSVNGQQSAIVMTARFRPRGLFGIAYWYAVLPLHGIVFRGMLNGMAAEASKLYAAPDS